MYYYRNGSLINSSTAVSSGYGGTANGDGSADIKETLYLLGQYRLGAFQLGTSSNPNHFWVESPICTQLGYPVTPLDLYDFSATYTAVKPTITGVAAFWYLGGAQGTPDSNGINNVSGYDVQTRLTGSANWGTSPAVTWQVVQGSDKVSPSASGASQNVLTSLAPSASYTPDVAIQISTDGLPSDQFMLTVNAPKSVIRRPLPAYAITNGYENDFAYAILDIVNNPVGQIILHETFENLKLVPPFSSTLSPSDPNYSNWITLPNSGPTAGNWLPNLVDEWTDMNEFIDHVFTKDSDPPSLVPTPVTISSAPRAVDDISQKFFIGDPNPNTFLGLCVSVGKLTYSNDHGESTGTSPVAAGACAPGVFGN